MVRKGTPVITAFDEVVPLVPVPPGPITCALAVTDNKSEKRVIGINFGEVNFILKSVVLFKFSVIQVN